MATQKRLCPLVAGDEDGEYLCEKTGIHVVHRSGDTRFVAAPGGPYLYGPRK